MFKIPPVSGMAPGPYGPMGAGTDIGLPVDMSRMKLPNVDGSFSTERTITVERGGRWYNVPTIVQGSRLRPDEAEMFFNMGVIPHVGEFPTLEQATRSAVARSAMIGKLRDGK